MLGEQVEEYTVMKMVEQHNILSSYENNVKITFDIRIMSLQSKQSVPKEEFNLCFSILSSTVIALQSSLEGDGPHYNRKHKNIHNYVYRL